MKGILYSVGVGPGDPELMTVKAVRTVRACPVVAAPRTAGGEMLALTIVREAVDLAGKTVLPLDFSMSGDMAAREADRAAAAAAVEAHLAAGRDVALLTLGDVSVYATCGYVRERLKARGYESVMIPGVPSFCAAAARLDMSLADGDEPLHIIPAGVGDLERALDYPGARVLMKAGRSLPGVLEALEARGEADSAALVANCGLPDERICPELRQAPRDAGYFVTVLVRGRG